jgi:hypothetical protein
MTLVTTVQKVMTALKAAETEDELLTVVTKAVSELAMRK